MSELVAFLNATFTTYAAGKSRASDPLRARLARSAFVWIATWKLRGLMRRARRLEIGAAEDEKLDSLIEDVFLERRVLRSPVPLLPRFPCLAERALRIGKDIFADPACVDKHSVGAVLQVCSSSLEGLIEAHDNPSVRASLSREHRKLIGMDALKARDLVAPPRALQIDVRPGSIAYVASMTLPYRNNGYCSRTEGIALAFAANGLSINVVSKPGFPLNLMDKKDAEKVPETEIYNNVLYHRLHHPRWERNNYSDYARKAADALEQKFRQLRPALVIAASDYRNSLPALVAARRLGLPFTYEVRGMWELTWASDHPGYENTRQFAVTQELEAFVCRQADAVLTLTQGMKQSLMARGVAGDKVALMPNGVSSEMLETLPRDEALAVRLGFAPQTVVIGYAGAFKEYEGLPDLAAAVAKLARDGHDVVLLIVGAEAPDSFGSTPITEEIRQAFDRAGQRSRLIMTGRVPFEDMPRYYSLMDICPITRRGYAVSELVSPIKPVEALAQGKAVVLSDVEALKFFAQDETTALLFRKGDVDDLAAKLAVFVRDKSLRDIFGQRGRHFVETELQWSHICRHAADHIGLRPPI